MNLHASTGANRLLEDLIAALFRPDQLRRFFALEFGEKVARQLPGENVSAETFHHEAVQLLVRNGLVDQDLFATLLRDRQGSRDEITRVADLFGVTLSGAEVQRVVEGPVTLTDQVIKDTYDDLRMQQQIVRDFLSGPWARLNAARLSGDSDPEGAERAGAACRAWATEHYRKVTLPELRKALEVLRVTTFVNPLRGGLEFALAAFSSQTWLAAIQALEQFTTRAPSDLWQIANGVLPRR